MDRDSAPQTGLLIIIDLNQLQLLLLSSVWLLQTDASDCFHAVQGAY